MWCVGFVANVQGGQWCGSFVLSGGRTVMCGLVRWWGENVLVAMHRYGCILRVTGANSFGRTTGRLFVTRSDLSDDVGRLRSRLKVRVFSHSGGNIFLATSNTRFVHCTNRAIRRVRFVTRECGRTRGVRELRVTARRCSFVSSVFYRLLGRGTSRGCRFSLHRVGACRVVQRIRATTDSINVLTVHGSSHRLVRECLGGRNVSFAPFLVASPFIFMGQRRPLTLGGRVAASRLVGFPCIFCSRKVGGDSFFARRLASGPLDRRQIRVDSHTDLVGILLDSRYCAVKAKVVPSRLGSKGVITVPLVDSRGCDVNCVLGRREGSSLLVGRFVGLLLRFNSGFGGGGTEWFGGGGSWSLLFFEWK